MTNPTRGAPRGPYAKTEHVRARILDAATSVFAESGFHATTKKQIAERARISERGLVHHFPRKSDVLHAVLQRRESANSERVTPQAGLEALLRMLALVADDGSHPELVELHTLLSTEAATPAHPAHDHYRNRYEMFRLFSTQSFRALRDAGLINSPLSDQELGASYVALSDGLQLQWLYDRDSVDSATILRRFLGSVIPSMRG